MMRVIIIPCSGRKHEGGAAAPRSHVRPQVDAEAWDALCGARAELATIRRVEPGADLDDCSSRTPALKAAWERYDGNLYRKARLGSGDVARPDLRILIVSALYGVIDARDSIRLYNLRMTDRLPDGTRVSRFWRARGLGEVVRGLLTRAAPDEVHDFLSLSYRDAVRDITGRYRYIRYEYPRLGNGADHHRGEQVRELLDRYSRDCAAT